MLRARVTAAAATLSFLLCGSCGSREDAIASAYVELAFAMDAHDPSYVDAFLGGERPEIVDLSLEDIRRRAVTLRERLAGAEEPERAAFLIGQLEALSSRASQLLGTKLDFDEESRAFFGVVVPEIDEAAARPILDELSTLMPSEGPLVDRYRRLGQRFRLPTAAIPSVAEAALEECREATLDYLSLPEEERVELRYARSKPWASYHEYQGRYRSIVWINRDVGWTVGRLFEAVCHESYPGHHVLTVLADRDLVRARGWLEHSVSVLRSPQGWNLEALANYGFTLAFDENARKRIELEVLYPLAEVPRDAETFLEVERRVRQLRPLAVEGARRYFNGVRDRAAMVLWLKKHALVPEAWAFTQFVDRYGSYVASYAYGEEMIRSYVESRATSRDDQWKAFAELVGASDATT